MNGAPSIPQGRLKYEGSSLMGQSANSQEIPPYVGMTIFIGLNSDMWYKRAMATDAR